VREARRDPRERQRDGVRQHVPGIGEQRERSGEQPAGDLHQHVEDGERERPEQPPLVECAAWS
jgi:hypothetical protein